jgi:hypothetical protein
MSLSCGRWRDHQRFGNPLIDPLMGTTVIEEGDVLTHCSSGVTLTENQDVIQAFAPNIAEKALAKCIGSWRLEGRLEQLDVSPRDSPLKLHSVLVIMSQIRKRGRTPKPVASRTC